MKTLFLFTLTVVLSLSLSARENPFEMKDMFEEETGKILEQNENPTDMEAMQEAQFIKETQKKEASNKDMVDNAVKKIVPVIDNKPATKTYSKQEVDSLIQKTKKQTEQKTKEIVKKELENVKEPEQVVYVKPRTDVMEDDALVSKKLFPFLKLQFNDNKLIIDTSDKVSKKFSVDKENKLIVDYKSKVDFLTKKESLESKNFKRVTVGNHQNEGFYRVAIELADKPSKYDVTLKDGLITISKTN